MCTHTDTHTRGQEYMQGSLNTPILWMQSNTLRHKIPVYFFINIKYSHEIKHRAVNPTVREFHSAFVVSVILEAFSWASRISFLNDLSSSMKYPVFIVAALFLLESGRIGNLEPFSSENTQCTHWSLAPLEAMRKLSSNLCRHYLSWCGSLTFLWKTKTTFYWSQRLGLRA